MLCSNDLLSCGELITLMSKEIRFSTLSGVTPVTLLYLLQMMKKKAAALFPEHIHRKSKKISIPLTHIQFKVISWLKNNKNNPLIKTPHKLFKIFTIAIMERYSLKIYKSRKTLQPEVSESCPYLTAFNFILVCFVNL